MKQRQLIWLGGALVLLLVIAYFTGVFDGEFSTLDVPHVEIPTEAVTSIEASGADLDVAIEKRNGTWFLTRPLDAAADSSTVAQVLDDLSALEFRNVVSTHPERHGRYGVDSAATELTVAWEGGSRVIVIGNPNAGSNYVRLGGDAAVYRSGQRLRVPDSVDDWRDKTIIDLSPDQITKVSIVGPDRSVELERRTDLWTLTNAGEPMQADSAAMQRYLDRFHPMLADGFVDQAPMPSDSSTTIRFGLSSGAERRLELTPAEDDYAVLVDGGETVFRLRSFRLSQIAPEASSFESR